MGEVTSSENELSKFLGEQIEKLRPKLLDLSRRNPLLAAPIRDRNNSLVRVVDEVPSILFEILSGGSMRLVPLPPLEDDPVDEKTTKFKRALARRRLTDEIYLEALEKIDHDDESAADELNFAERALKDRLRKAHEMPPRQTKQELSIVQHAKNNNVRPSYELPDRDLGDDDGRHTDNDIQTLLLPDVFERRLNAINTKVNTWEQETGISVLQATFGFLEWAESESSETSIAPLLLMPAVLNKERTSKGVKFTVSGDEGITDNFVLAEKLRSDFNIELPRYEPGTPLEDYFSKIHELSPKGMQWRFRRQVAIGVFPSARIAMYYDLDSTRYDFGEHPTILQLFGGYTGEVGGSPYGDDYEVDNPQVEDRVPTLVMDADSSQFSTIVDVMDGKNLAVEGPPGTGKSQTIVNTIAAALAANKKVLFVAEKTAALDVVRSRLEAVGLGEFILPLMANRSGRQQVIQSIRERLAVGRLKPKIEVAEKIKAFRSSRSRLAEYLEVLKSMIGETGLTVHEILGYELMSRQALQNWPDKVFKHSWPTTASLKQTDFDNLIDIARSIEAAAEEASLNREHWSICRVSDLDPFHVGEILEAAGETAETYRHNLEIRDKLAGFGLNPNENPDQLIGLHDAIKKIDRHQKTEEIDLAERILNNNQLAVVSRFLNKAENVRASRDNLASSVSEPHQDVTVEKLGHVIGLLKELDIKTTQASEVDALESTVLEKMAAVKTMSEAYEQAAELCNAVSNCDVLRFERLCQIANTISREALSLRDPGWENALNWRTIDQASSNLDRLVTIRKSLNEKFYLERSTSTLELTSHLMALANAGLFSVFSKKYRNAKQYYRLILRRGKYDKKVAIADMRSLVEWTGNVEKFENDEHVKALLGSQFRGLNTDFELPTELINFYRDILNEFPKVQDQKIRQFLFSGDVGQIMSLPIIILDLEVLKKLNFGSQELLEDYKADLSIFVETLSKGLRDLRSLTSELNFPSGCSTSFLKKLRPKLKALCEEWQGLENSSVRSVLGDRFFKGAETKKEDLEGVIRFVKLLARLPDDTQNILIDCQRDRTLGDLDELLGNIHESDHGSQTLLDHVCAEVNCHDQKTISKLSRREVAEFFAEASGDKQGLLAHSQHFTQTENLVEMGYGYLTDCHHKMKVPKPSLAEGLAALIYHCMAKEVYLQFGPVLAKFTGSKLSSIRRKIAALDREVIELSRAQLRSELISHANPPAGNGSGRKKTWTEMHLIENETNKKRAYVSARELTKRSGRALLELKPCWMMSPLAAAQYIEKSQIQFDLVVIDEASQMTPENAIGALVRGRQAMVVGDTNQLPPTSFFRTIIAEIDEDDEDQILDESILERANTAFRPMRRLRWHYRSKNSALIAFSNKWIYDDELVIFPSASEGDKRQGVALVEVDGKYSKGANPEEATVMAKAIEKFMSSDPDRSLGVVVVNVKQRDLLEEEVEYLMASNRAMRRYKEKWDTQDDGLQYFFIKNLENVQGDERDVIFIGTVYGPEKQGGAVMQRFGPINGVAGKRRLNVLFSRAREKIVTFSSMSVADILGDRNLGADLLKKWLEYSGSLILEGGESTWKEPDSPFEEYVIQQINSLGCEAVPQVGVKGYSIDIGIKHSDWPYGFLLGVECDGATYHSSKSARDRDRIRQEVLESLGWHLHRIWSTDWFNDPFREVEKLKKAITRRLKELKSNENEYQQPLASAAREEEELVADDEHAAVRLTEAISKRLKGDERDESVSQNSRTAASGENGYLELDKTYGAKGLGARKGENGNSNGLADERLDGSPIAEHSDNVIQFNQPLLGDEEPVASTNTVEEAEKELIAYREKVIFEEFPDADQEQGLLRKPVIILLLENLPVTPEEFRSIIPLYLREKTDPRQMKFLPDILEILENVDS